MKILQILPQLNIGGVERGTLDLSKALIQKIQYLTKLFLQDRLPINLSEVLLMRVVVQKVLLLII